MRGRKLEDLNNLQLHYQPLDNSVFLVLANSRAILLLGKGSGSLCKVFGVSLMHNSSVFTEHLIYASTETWEPGTQSQPQRSSSAVGLTGIE